MSGWAPDDHLVPAALLGNVAVKKLDPFDRAWVIAGLFREGLTADAIAEKCACSLRLVFQIKAEPITVAFSYVQEQMAKAEADRITAEGRVSVLRSRLIQAEMDVDRYRGQAYGRSLSRQ